MPADVADRMRERLREAAARRPGRAAGFRLGRLVAGAAAAGLALAAASALPGRNPRLHPLPVEEAPTPFERAAIEIFDQAESGGAPLQRRSGSPAELRRFVNEHTGLGVQLAPHRPAEDDGRFQPVGARTLLVEGARTAAVLYEVDGRPVVLLTAREGEVRERPSRWTPFGKDVSHRGVGGRQVLTWTNSGQVYTLVSRLPSHGSPGCLLCHTDSRRRAQIRQIG
jgi:hypothetical protein